MVNLEDLVIEEAFNLGLKCIISRKKKKVLARWVLKREYLGERST